ncbi:MAG: peptidylprolyl isomerase [Clostridia bacterium]|nr:peptidylprolyl isomerase [Clostridia bacterium]
MKIKSIIAAALVMTAALTLTSCGAKAPAPTATPAPTSTAAPSKSLEELTSRKDYVEITVNVNGEDKVMKAELYPDLAPETVANFEKLASENFYDGLIFHRVISGFMIQGGGYSEDMTEKETASIKGEFKSNGFENPLKHERGVLSMARTSVPDSASSQFFIMHEDYPSLDGEYAAFGKVTEGLEVIDEIASQPTKSLENGMSDVPENPIVIKSIKISLEG